MRKAFTLIELLIVIALIGVLSTIIAISYPNYIKRTRDAQRKSDLKQYQIALENYAGKVNNNGLYPANYTSATRISTTICGVLVITSCPEDPLYVSDNSIYYKYISDAVGLGYIIWAKLEVPSVATYWVACGNGKTGESTSTPPYAACPL